MFLQGVNILHSQHYRDLQRLACVSELHVLQLMCSPLWGMARCTTVTHSNRRWKEWRKSYLSGQWNTQLIKVINRLFLGDENKFGHLFVCGCGSNFVLTCNPVKTAKAISLETSMLIYCITLSLCAEKKKPPSVEYRRFILLSKRSNAWVTVMKVSRVKIKCAML